MVRYFKSFLLELDQDLADPGSPYGGQVPDTGGAARNDPPNRGEKRIYTTTGDCYPTKNICTFFLTPDQEVVYYVAGYYAPDLFLEILEAVDAMRTAGTEAEQKRGHRLAYKNLGTRLSEVRKASSDVKKVDSAQLKQLMGDSVFQYKNEKHRHTTSCLWVLRRLLEYRQTVHSQLAQKGFVPFHTVQHEYRYGNSFTEEADKRDLVPATLARPQTPDLTTTTQTQQ